MNKIYLIFFKFLFSRAPLFLLQLIGIMIGHIFHTINKKSRNLLVKNLTSSKIYKNDIELYRAIKKILAKQVKQ